MLNKAKLLVWIAAGLFCAAVWAVFFSLLWFAALLSLSMVLGVVGHFIDHDPDLECGFDDTVYGPRLADVIPFNRDILRRDPRAYPLTRRPVWPNSSGAPE